MLTLVDELGMVVLVGGDWQEVAQRRGVNIVNGLRVSLGNVPYQPLDARVSVLYPVGEAIVTA